MGGAVARIVRPSRPTPAPAPPPTPTAPEVSQATATAMDGYDARKTKARGRSTTILTGPKGVEEETLTLGRKSLLGR
jgi:hypothetical protein|tara:strand:+ start:397 stop:627 length:231 start_codon:yes stop_codon:yes gene_type:complete